MDIVLQPAAVADAVEWLEPTDADLDAIEAEMPAILADAAGLDLEAEVLTAAAEWLDALIGAVRPVRAAGERPVRRAHRRTLAARRDLTNHTTTTTTAVSALGSAA
ncbi:DUF6284 family protein [Streptomyces clavuligerus]|uniref:DUF6284 family protein n=1 Tax=Streptomyces clavuligerus TaxID=1901 RepID=UPI00018522A2|nr:DUF6284 family protein [Streptomyces clavuligerus]ANW18109.1 hypothetical protein BB341_07670 [Streptomyces clavuligerus]AXU12670.1 hypothetical protein D1794_07960 [Streptomyces clavuligerus]MBY6302573.1 hypothetical protein [Streptomyces clavuligerus]QCS05453.1 hypothetical protein CRV15_07390 [Streptomyces clavuligerus]QPJ95178.1 hypothetical protein GE265_20515 [Streptomyces clavuligerus]